MRQHHRPTLFLSCMLAAMAAGSGCENTETGSETAQRPKVGVTQPVTRPVVEYAYFTGQIQAVKSVQVRARVTGYLKAITYTPGKLVNEGAVLFEIDPRPYQAQFDIADGKLAEAKSQVEEAKAKVAQADARVGLNRSKLAIDQEVAKTKGAVSKLTLEEDSARVKESEATLEAVKATVISLQATVKAAKANLEYNQNNLNWTKVTSPIHGRVDRNLLTEGNLVNADVTVLTNIDAIDEVYVYFNVDELKFLEVQKAVREGVYAKDENVPLAVALQNEKDFPHEGTVDLVANALSMGTGTMEVRGILKNPQSALTPGNFVRVRLALDKARDKLLVPERGVVYEQGDAFLLVVGADDKVEKRKVTLGSLDPNDKTLRVIDEGLKRDERVIIQGRQRVRPGMEVQAEQVAQAEKK
jgi:membrane fusion protein, multidrug efflux system